VIRGDLGVLDKPEQALARWARLVAHDPNATTAGDVEALRDAGFEEAQIFGITAFVALRLAFSTINDSLGAVPDHQLRRVTPAPVRSAIVFGRTVGDSDTSPSGADGG
jgi:hypothetical protein